LSSLVSNWLVTLKSAPLLGEFITQNDWTFSEQARVWIWGTSGPESISRNRQQFKLRNLRRGFTHIPTNGDAIESEMRDSVQSGLSLLKRKQTAKRLEARQEASKKLKIAQEDEESDEPGELDADPFAEYIQLKAPTSRTATVTVLDPQPSISPALSITSSSLPPFISNATSVVTTESVTSPATTTTEVTQKVLVDPLPPVPKDFPPINLDHHSTSTELEMYGLEHLKHELKRRGLKCGGSLSQRGARLLLLKTVAFETLDKKHKA